MPAAGASQCKSDCMSLPNQDTTFTVPANGLMGTNVSKARKTISQAKGLRRNMKVPMTDLRTKTFVSPTNIKIDVTGFDVRHELRAGGAKPGACAVNGPACKDNRCQSLHWVK